MASVAAIAAITGAVGALGATAGGAIQARRSFDEADTLKDIRDAELEEIKRRGRKLRGRQRVAQAASGVVVDEGTPLDVLAETAEQVELERLRTRFSFDRARQQKREQGRAQIFNSVTGLFGTGFQAATLLGRGGGAGTGTGGNTSTAGTSGSFRTISPFSPSRRPARRFV